MPKAQCQYFESDHDHDGHTEVESAWRDASPGLAGLYLACLADGRTDDAQLLAQVIARFVSTSSVRDADAARRLAVAVTGSSLDGPEPSAPSTSALTAAEARVCLAIADGLSNKAIARQLFLSCRTVEAHVARVLRKLDMSSRVQIAVLFASTRVDRNDRLAS